MNEESVVARFAEPLYRAKGWMKFVGVLAIIQGVFSILSLWGILVCWIPIWMGVVLCSASNHIRTAVETNSNEEFRTSMEKLGTYFRICGVLALVMFVIVGIGLVAALVIPSLLHSRQSMIGE